MKLRLSVCLPVCLSVSVCLSVCLSQEWTPGVLLVLSEGLMPWIYPCKLLLSCWWIKRWSKPKDFSRLAAPVLGNGDSGRAWPLIFPRLGAGFGARCEVSAQARQTQREPGNSVGCGVNRAGKAARVLVSADTTDCAEQNNEGQKATTKRRD